VGLVEAAVQEPEEGLGGAHTPPLTLSAPALTLDDLRATFPGF